MKNFNLLQILPSLESGGVEKGTVDLANFLAAQNINSYIISNGGKMRSYLNKKNVTHITLPVHSKNFLKMPITARKINTIIKKNKIDIVHVRSRVPAWILKFVTKKNFKTVSTFHNIYGSEFFFKKKYNLAMKDVDKIVAISKFVKSSITKLYQINPKKITVIHRGIDTDFYDPEIKKEDDFKKFLSKFNLPSDKKIILFPGRLAEWKGQINFLNVLEQYKGKNIFCYFVGDDKNNSYTQKFFKKIKDKKLDSMCKILGQLSQEDLRMMYICSDVIISAPLKPEGFCRVIGEGLAMKKIVLSYNYGGAKEQLDDLDSIFKIVPNDQIDLKNKIDKVFKLSNSHKSKIGSIARDHIINNFSKEKMLNKYLNFYKRVIL
tara:strand:+ start:222 stop:1352 length:1131 start_codon:yes stop_codon:yes gene_type:complete